MMVDFAFIRVPLMLGGLILLVTEYVNYEVNQLQIHAMELLITGAIMIGLQIYLLRTWEEQQLPFKMRDTKHNYLFKNLRFPDEEEREILEGLEDEDPFIADWNKWLPFYNMPEIFLDNKLEELLNVFGKRQCKSCTDFPTKKLPDGCTDDSEDERHMLKRRRSFPLSPKAAELYQGMEGEFNLIDFQLQNNVYHDAHEAAPSNMFQSVARDFSDFGVQVFAFDVVKALNRKGGDLVNPNIEDRDTRKTNRKQRGRKNKYYRQIDDEDDQEANHISGSEYERALDGIREEDEEDDEELIKRRQEQ
jgi:hypothetical protein